RLTMDRARVIRMAGSGSPPPRQPSEESDMRPARMANLITASLWIVGALLCSSQSGWAIQRSLPTAALGKGATNDPVGAPIGIIARTFSAETRSSANLLLDSSLGKFLSGSGRNALELVAAPPGAMSSLVAGHELASADALQLAPGNVRVNDPNQDP